MTQIYVDDGGPLVVRGGEGFRLKNFRIDDLFSAADPLDWLESRLLGGAAEFDPENATWRAPLGSQEVWAAGVTYKRSRSARMEESEESGGDRFYDMVYEAERPELFFKATAARSRGHGDPIRIRADSDWDVPEPELAVAINGVGKVFGWMIANDVSSRSIEGENPLYLPQAKVYAGSCALGPCLSLGEGPAPDAFVRLEIRRAGELVFEGETDLTRLKRSPQELADWLFRENEFPHGAVLMTGTGIVPDADFTLQSHDRVAIAIDGLGQLVNFVE